MYAIALIVLAIVLAIPMNRWALFWHTMSSRMLVIELAFVFLILIRLSRNAPLLPRNIRMTPFFYSWMAYCLCTLISLFWAHSLMQSQTALVEQFWYCWAFIYIFACGSRKPHELLWALYAFVLAALPLCWEAFMFGVEHEFKKATYLDNATTGHVIIGDICAATALVAFAMFLTRRKLPWKIISIVVGFIAASGLLASQCRGAVVGTVLAVIFMAFLARVRSVRLIAIALFFPLAVAVLLKIAPEETQKSTLDSSQRTSAHYRIWATEVEMKHIMNHPLEPIGVGNLLVTKDETEPLLDYWWNIIIGDYIQLGPQGAIALLAMIASSLWLCIQNAGRLKVNSAAGAINTCCSGIILLYWIHSMLDSFWYNSFEHSVPFAAIGMVLFVKMWLDNQDAVLISKSSTQVADVQNDSLQGS